MIDGLPAEFNQSCEVEMFMGQSVIGEEMRYRVDVVSSIVEPPAKWSVLRSYSEFKSLRQSLIQNFDMQVLKELEFPKDRAEKLMRKMNKSKAPSMRAIEERMVRPRLPPPPPPSAGLAADSSGGGHDRVSW